MASRFVAKRKEEIKIKRCNHRFFCYLYRLHVFRLIAVGGEIVADDYSGRIIRRFASVLPACGHFWDVDKVLGYDQNNRLDQIRIKYCENQWPEFVYLCGGVRRSICFGLILITCPINYSSISKVWFFFSLTRLSLRLCLSTKELMIILNWSDEGGQSR